MRIGCRSWCAVNCSSRVNSSCTGRPVLSAASATNVLGRASPACRRSRRRPARRTPGPVGGQVEDWHSVAGSGTAPACWCGHRALPSASDPGDAAVGLQARVLHALGRATFPVDDVGLARSAAATSPISPCISATTLRAASAIRDRRRLVAVDQRRARRASPASGSNTAGRIS